MIQELCAKLKAKRVEMGYSMEEIVEKTKLHPSVIKDIEAGELEKINKTYIKGFVKIYAAFLGVEVGAALDEISHVKAHIRREPRTITTAKQVRRPKLPLDKIPFEKIKKPLIFIIAAIVIFLILSALIKAIVNRPKQAPAVVTPPKVEEKVEPKSPPVVDTDQVNVSVTAKRDCFLRVRADGLLLFEGVLKKGATESWNAEREMDFKISDGSALYIEANGKALPPLTAMRKPIKSLKITPSGTSVEK